jgi:hypothetical protein
MARAYRIAAIPRQRRTGSSRSSSRSSRSGLSIRSSTSRGNSSPHRRRIANPPQSALQLAGIKKRQLSPRALKPVLRSRNTNAIHFRSECEGSGESFTRYPREADNQSQSSTSQSSTSSSVPAYDDVFQRFEERSWAMPRNVQNNQLLKASLEEDDSSQLVQIEQKYFR